MPLRLRCGAPLSLALLLAFSGCALISERTASTHTPLNAINPGIPWPATDALGRSLPVAANASGLKSDRAVGIFYFLWHDVERTDPAYNIATILAKDPDILQKPDSPLWGPRGTPYYWGEPLYHYYNSKDPWVLRRHAMLLADAGIDTVIFDTTNRRTYPDVYRQLCEVWTQIRQEGGRTPQVCFMVNTKAGETAQELYNDFYKPGLYPDLWFRWQGKPLLICDPTMASAEVAAFFTLRKAHWPFTQVNTQRAWHWEATYPQVYGYAHDPKKPEQVNVSIAQNLRDTDGKVVNMSDGNARGRSFHAGRKDLAPGAVNHGHNAAEQWRRALELDPPFVMVTGWNEWTAGKFSRPGKPVVFVDQFDQEYSRDIEPVSGLHQDHYYYQLVDGVRRYKGLVPLPSAPGPKTIKLSGGFEQWRDIGPAFIDHAFDNDHRAYGRGARRYENASGRNDLIQLKVAHDATHIYFYAQTREPLTSPTGKQWMTLLIDRDGQRATGWEGYDFAVNRTVEGNTTWLERCRGGSAWEKITELEFRHAGNELMLAIPRAALGLAGGEQVTFDFKWWDHGQKPGDIMDVYVSGDAAPEGRFNYRYGSGLVVPAGAVPAQ